MTKRKRCTKCKKLKVRHQFNKNENVCKKCRQLGNKINAAIRWLDGERQKKIKVASRTPSIDCPFECETCGMGATSKEAADKCCKGLIEKPHKFKSKYEGGARGTRET